MEFIPARGPALLICNHISFVDWLFISAMVPRPVRFVIDYEYFRGSLRPLLQALRVIPIAGPREDARLLEAAYQRVAEELRQGELVCIFPEGRISRDGKLGHFKPGVMKILKETPVPVVPMALKGLWGSFFSHALGPPFRKWPRRFRARVELVVQPPASEKPLTLAHLQQRVASMRSVIEP